MFFVGLGDKSVRAHGEVGTLVVEHGGLSACNNRSVKYKKIKFYLTKKKYFSVTI